MIPNLMTNTTFIYRVLNAVLDDNWHGYYWERERDQLFDPLFPDDQIVISKGYDVDPFWENILLNQIPEIKKSFEYFIMYRVKRDPDCPVPKKDHVFVPCRYANLKPAGYLPGPNINQGWIKTDDGLFKRAYSPRGCEEIHGLIIKDNALFIERRGICPQLIKVIAVPDDIKKTSREKWLKGCAYTLTDEPENLISYLGGSSPVKNEGVAA